MMHDVSKKPCLPLPLLEIHHRCRNKEPVAASSCTNAGDIKMGPSGVGLFNGPIGVAGTWLLER